MGKPKQKHRTSSHKFKELRGQFDDLGEEVLKLERADASNKRKRQHWDGPKKGMIPKPPGTAGKGGSLGYNLQIAMGLSGDKNHQIYLSLLQKVRKAAPSRGIDVTKTIRHNSRRVVDLFVVWCQKKWPFFCQFEDGWPVRDILANYLVNQKAAKKLQGKKLKAAGIGDSDLESLFENDKCDEDAPPPKKCKRDAEDTESNKSDDKEFKGEESKGKEATISKKYKKSKKIQVKKSAVGRPKGAPAQAPDIETDVSGDDSMNIPPSKARKIHKLDCDTKPIDRNKNPGSIEDIFSDVEIGLPRKFNLPQESSSDSDVDSDGYEDAQPAMKSKFQIKPQKGSAPKPFHWTKSDIPSTCPEEDCLDGVVTNPSPTLIALFRDRAKAIHKQEDVYKLNIKICVQIKVEHIIDLRQRRAEKHGLINVDFQLLANRVWNLKNIIDPFMCSPVARSDMFIWTNLFDDFKTYQCSAVRLNKGKDIPREIVASARPGFYGERGAAIIKNTLMGMYSLITADKIPASDPLTLDAYWSFVLIPYIAAWLIGEDENTDLEGGWEIMQLQADHGDDENRLMDDDPVLDSVFAANANRRKVAVAGNDKKGKTKTKHAQVTHADKENTKPAAKAPTCKTEPRTTRSGTKSITLCDFPVPSTKNPNWKVVQPNPNLQDVIA